MISNKTKARLLAVLDTVDASLWSKRAADFAGKIDDSAQSVQVIAMTLAQLGYNSVLSNDKDLLEARLKTVESHAQLLPEAYKADYEPKGCIGPEGVNETEVDFAVETVLHALREHHDLGVIKGQLANYWTSNTLPKLKSVVKDVLEMRNANQF